ncbi:hypothetical protein H0H92_006224 [Tricholoma furcatifolium]|nr:hypothetical protein H0H92_006224 [Tricholoma furcatifolium]
MSLRLSDRLGTNIIVSSMLVLGGSATVTDLTGMSTIAGNAGGSYLTMRSKNGLIFGVINIIGNFATVFNDQAYWQRAIASQPATCVKAYLLGGLAWSVYVSFYLHVFAHANIRFAIPFTLSTSLGLAAVALTALGDTSMRVLTPLDVSEGLPAPAAAAALLGKAGAAAMLVLLFLAVTSASSAEMIAVSSILTYDVYKVSQDNLYFALPCLQTCIAAIYQPTRDGRADFEGVALHGAFASALAASCDADTDPLKVVVYAFVMSIAGLIFYYIDVSMGWLYSHMQTFMGVVLGSAVVPIALCITWSKANKWGCICGAVGGFSAGILAWLVTTASLNGGVINVTTTGGNYEMLAGNLASIGVGGIIAVAWSLISPENFDFTITRAINAPNNPITRSKSAEQSGHGEDVEKRDKTTPTPEVNSINDASSGEFGVMEEPELNIVELNKAFKFAAWSSVVLTIFGVRGFGAWVTIGILWTFCSIIAVVMYPLWESKRVLGMVFCGIIKDVFGGGAGKYAS